MRSSIQSTFIELFIEKHLLNFCCILGTVLGAEISAGNQEDVFLPSGNNPFFFFLNQEMQLPCYASDKEGPQKKSTECDTAQERLLTHLGVSRKAYLRKERTHRI